MVTNEDLRREGFEYSEDSKEWKRNNINLTVNDDGKITFIRADGESFAGNVRILDVKTLKTVVSVIA